MSIQRQRSTSTSYGNHEPGEDTTAVVGKALGTECHPKEERGNEHLMQQLGDHMDLSVETEIRM